MYIYNSLKDISRPLVLFCVDIVSHWKYCVVKVPQGHYIGITLCVVIPRHCFFELLAIISVCFILLGAYISYCIIPYFISHEELPCMSVCYYFLYFSDFHVKMI